MRLTLRTLLAYLDDTLDPAQAKEIGQKVAESPQAQELIERIKDVVKRRMAPPPLNAADARIDPDTLASYIDSVLPADKLTEVENICLESDIYLAEVASCHQILSVVQSEPALVPPTAKARMYDLIKGGKKKHVARPVAVEADHGVGAYDDDADETLLLGLPSLFREGGWGRRLLPLAGGLLLAVGLIVAIFFALPKPGDLPNNSFASVAPNRKESDDKGNENTKAPDNGKDKAEPKVKEKEKEKTSGQPKEKEKPPDKPEPMPMPEPKPDPEPKPPAAGRQVVGSYRLAGNIPSYLLVQPTAGDLWKRIRPDGEVATTERLMSLPGFKSDIKLNSGVALQLWGNAPENVPYFTLESEVVLNNPAADYALDLKLERGRVVIKNAKPAGNARVRIRVKKESWEVNLLEPGSEIGLELWGFYPPGVPFTKEGKGEEPMAGVGLFALKGPSHLKIRYDTYLMNEAPGRNAFLWDNTGPAARPPEAWEQDRLPRWVRKNPPPLPKELAQVQTAVVALQRRLQSGQPIDEVLHECLKDKDIYLRVLAVAGLGSINDLNRLIDCLGNDQDRNQRIAAINVLRHWIGLDPANEQKLYGLLDKRFSSGVAEIIMSLMHDFGERQMTDPHTYEALILYLRHDKLAVRELAFFQLAMLAPDGAKAIPFDPAGNVDQRDNAFRQWKAYIPDGKLPPPPKRANP